MPGNQISPGRHGLGKSLLTPKKLEDLLGLRRKSNILDEDIFAFSVKIRVFRTIAAKMYFYLWRKLSNFGWGYEF